jgi:nicotinate dehydrogenase subunit B
MVHARALLPPSTRAVLDRLDVAAVRGMAGVVEVVADDRLVIVIAVREEQAVKAVARLQQGAAWTFPETDVHSGNVFDAMRRMKPERYVARQTGDGTRPDGAAHRATYSQPYQAHAAIAPSCAVAHDTGKTLRVWTHSQGVYPLQRALADLLDAELDSIEVLHRDGPGCYGHNLADDAAAYAAVAARAVPERPVRFQFSVTDEFTWEPLGPAMVADLKAAPRDAPSALNAVVVPNVTLPRELHDKFNKWGKDGYP